MKTRYLTSLALAAALALPACGTQDAAESQADATSTETPVDPNNPFASLEQQMSERMMGAVGADAGDSWVRKMIEHHQGAIDMSRLMLEQNPSEHVAKMARDSIDKQTKEIADLRKLFKEGSPNQASADLYKPAMMTMQQAMMAATGSTVEETFMRKMLAHHKGGVALSDVALQNGVSGAVRSQVAKTKAGQQKEAEMTEAMLRGEPMPKETEAAAAPAPAAKSTPSAGTNRPRAVPTPAETADPHAGHAMSDQ